MPTVAQIQIQEDLSTDTVKVVHASGEIDESNLSELEQVVTPLVKDQQVPVVILNFEGLEFINSKVIGYLASIFATTKKADNQLVMAGANETINDILSLVGLTTIVPQFPSVQDALSSVS